MYRYKLVTVLLLQIMLPLALVESSNFSTRVEYKEVNTVPSNLHKNLEPFKLIGRNYYYIAKDEENWFQAAQKCRNLSSNLINLANDEERLFISLYLNETKKYWLDLNNLGQEDYISISTGSHPVYVKWIDKAMKVDDERKCVALVSDSQENGFVMKKVKCLEKSRFICQLKSPRTISILVW